MGASMTVGGKMTVEVHVPTVEAGSRLVFHSGGTAIPLRALADLCVDGSWCLAVMAPTAALLPGTGIVELPTDIGLLRLHARVHLVDGVATLVPLPEASAQREASPRQVEQRRGHVRAAVDLAVRCSEVRGGTDRARREAVAGTVIEGRTLSLSGGGLSARMIDTGVAVEPGRLVRVELDVATGQVVHAVATVVEHRTTLLRVAFSKISAVDRERLVRLVFAQQRLELAARAQRRGRQ